MLIYVDVLKNKVGNRENKFGVICIFFEKCIEIECELIILKGQ
jgi:hypothetical protein